MVVVILKVCLATAPRLDAEDVRIREIVRGRAAPDNLKLISGGDAQDQPRQARVHVHLLNDDFHHDPQFTST